MDQRLFSIQSVNYTDYTTGKKEFMFEDNDLSALRSYFEANCANQTTCKIGLDNLGLPKQKDKNNKNLLVPAASHALIRGACLNVINANTYRIIYTMFTVLNPVCLIIFMFFADRINGF